jgi:cell division protein FtsQ
MKKVYKILPEICLLLFLMISMSMVGDIQKDSRCKDIRIYIENNEDYILLEETDVTPIIRRKCGVLKGTQSADIKVAELEKTLNKISSIKKSQVFYDVAGNLHIAIKQREPIVRVLNDNGESYYIDRGGKVMPLSNKYNARVIIANGVFDTPYLKYLDVSNLDSLQENQFVLHSIFILSEYITRDEFWQKMIEQIYVNEKGNFILTPKIGPKEIEIGTIENMEYKLNKIKVFYEQGFPQKGFNVYKKINVSYSNQVIATRIK